MRERLELIFGAGCAIGVGLVWVAQYLDPGLGGWAWLVGGALAVLCGVLLVLLGAGIVLERVFRRVAWTPVDRAAPARPPTDPRSVRSIVPGATGGSGGSSAQGVAPAAAPTGWKRFVGWYRPEYRATAECIVSFSLPADLEASWHAVRRALASPGWEPSATDMVEQPMGAYAPDIEVRAPAGPADQEAELIGAEPYRALASHRVVARVSMRRAGPSATAVTLSGACAWNGSQKRAAQHLVAALDQLRGRIEVLSRSSAASGVAPR